MLVSVMKKIKVYTFNCLLLNKCCSCMLGRERKISLDHFGIGVVVIVLKNAKIMQRIPKMKTDFYGTQQRTILK